MAGAEKGGTQKSHLWHYTKSLRSYLANGTIMRKTLAYCANSSMHGPDHRSGCFYECLDRLQSLASVSADQHHTKDSDNRHTSPRRVTAFIVVAVAIDNALVIAESRTSYPST